jgi:DNA-binding response OmpR family regulator
MKVLLLEDEPSLNQHITKYLTLKGNEVESFDDGLELLDSTNLYEYDFFIFDINVPNVNGLEILEFLREKNIDVPVIMISALINIEDVKKAYKLGCSDYLKKPFELMELELRMESILKQFHFTSMIDLGEEHTYDLLSKQVFINKEAVILSKKQNEILYILIKNRGKVISFSTISDYIYEDEMKDFHTISSHVRDIRKKLKLDLIKNVRGVGYVIK